MSSLSNASALFTFSRGGVPEIVVHGFAFVEGDETVSNSLPSDLPIVTRSLLKPLQAMAVDLGGATSGHEDYWALTTASHSGQEEHIAKLSQLEQAIGVSRENLACPESFPMDPARAGKLKATGQKPDRLNHPCSGKHFAILGGAKVRGFSLKGYMEPDHAIQKHVRQFVESYVDERVNWVTDSCGLPSAVFGVRAHVSAWKRFARDRHDTPLRLKHLWTSYPLLVGGKGRLDSEIAQAFPGRLIAKEGADGLLMVQALESQRETVMVKVASGYNSKFLALGALAALRRTSNMSPLLVELRDWLDGRVSEFVPADQEFRT